MSGGSITQSWASGSVFGNDNNGGLVGNLNSGNIIQSWASGNISGNDDNGGLVGKQDSGRITQSWASGNISGNNNGGLVGNKTGGSIIGRNYRLDASTGAGVTNSFHLADATALANLSGDASGTGNTSYETHSGWHAGFDLSDPPDAVIDLETRFCDTNQNGTIDDGTTASTNEQIASNSVWVMPPTANDVTTDTNEAGQMASYYQIPALRCTGITTGIINEVRKANIDLQRRQFPTN